MNINLPDKSASILIGPPLAGKKDFLFDYMVKSLEKEVPIIFIVTDSSPEQIKNELVKRKIFFGMYKEKLKFIDCYSLQSGNIVSDTTDSKRISGPLALNEISIALANIERDIFRKNPKHMVIFDSLSTLLMYSNPRMVGRFLQVLIAKIKNAGGSIIFTLEEGMHDQKDIVTIEHLMNVIIHVKHEEGKTTIKVEGIGQFEEWTVA